MWRLPLVVPASSAHKTLADTRVCGQNFNDDVRHTDVIFKIELALLKKAGRPFIV